ncbi:MAG: rod shape-determining protein MreC [Rhodospirillaceae bacterium BRH_c57]|nr:MAG: rod shape-determining protein MreC [Rhodospirillaceae bacterium BRH_c57]
MPVKQPSPSPSRLGALRSLVGRFAFLALVGSAFALMLLGKADTALIERLRGMVSDTVVPALEIVSRPAASVAKVIDNVREMAAIREQNALLREENERLLRWQAAARLLEAENDSLKDLLNYVPDPRASFVTARVVADTGGAFAHSVLITAGERELVEKGQAVVSGHGLVGRVAEAGKRSARVLLVTDINSRIPVVVGAGRLRGILAGDNTDRPRILYLRTPGAVSPGDRVMTSGAAGAFPPGLPVGVVSSVEETAIRIEPFLKRERLEFVRVVDYGMTGILRDVTASDGPVGRNR